LNKERNNAVLVLTSFDATHSDIAPVLMRGGTDGILNPDTHHIVMVNLIGNGFSISPSNAPAQFQQIHKTQSIRAAPDTASQVASFHLMSDAAASAAAASAAAAVITMGDNVYAQHLLLESLGLVPASGERHVLDLHPLRFMSVALYPLLSHPLVFIL
jgi:homoserine acetyltransferase